ncbi:hypothetical protein Q9L42_008420 [Methylomarinum sp. Ch1-1]|uniref:Uncharacterized protein n=1 Tax=Methylomarinum roseum TaxID=3067653 RepID=A0AAU7NYR8_9GAMM|nr:hypothetical protein [Methylomarinum sp. Ch1-1]MDP4521750.1 hypothetical protein [Methylomarinum sp. Ch1-1]
MEQQSGNIVSNLVDIIQRRIFFAEIRWRQGIIRDIRQLGDERPGSAYLLPGFVDASSIPSSKLWLTQSMKKPGKDTCAAGLADQQPHPDGDRGQHRRGIDSIRQYLWITG